MRIRRGRPEPDAPIRELLRDLAELRLTISSDLIIAAAATDAERPDLAGEVLESDSSELAAFAARVGERLSALDRGERAAVVPAQSRKRFLPASSAIAAATLATALTGGVAAAAVAGVAFSEHSSNSSATPGTADTSQKLQASYDDFRRAISEGATPAQVVAAAEALHNSLVPLLAAAATDPNSAHRALQILQAETRILEETTHTGGTDRVLALARALVAQLTGTSSGRPGVSVPSADTNPLVIPLSPSPKAKPTPQHPVAAPAATPSAKPSPTPTHHSPSPSPSTSPTPPWPLDPPGVGGHGDGLPH